MMTAKPVCIVTGANTGIGFQTASALALKGYTVVLAVRNVAQGQDAAAAINSLARDRGGDALVMQLDNSKLRSVRDFATAFLARHKHLHALVLNAGISGIGVPHSERATEDGFQLVFQVNFLAAFLLAQLLLPRLKATAVEAPIAPVRVVLLSSVTHRTVEPIPDWARLIRSGKGFKSSYALSKLACTLFAYHLARGLASEGSKVVAVAVNPGAVDSDIWRSVPGWVQCWFRHCRRAFFLRTAQGAATSVAAASAGEVRGRVFVSGRPYYLTPYWIPDWAQNERYTLEIPSLLFDLIGPSGGARVARSTAASHDPIAARNLVLAATEAVSAALSAS